MVTPFVIKHTNEAGDEMTYTGDNITNISVEFNTPIAPMPLPQMEDKENILIKVPELLRLLLESFHKAFFLYPFLES